MSDTRIGVLLDETAVRDAIHMAIAPVIASEDLFPGQHIGLLPNGQAAPRCAIIQAIGIVDPFLPQRVMRGERFYLWLYPQTVTGMRHHWEHPAFPEINELPNVMRGLLQQAINENEAVNPQQNPNDGASEINRLLAGLGATAQLHQERAEHAAQARAPAYPVEQQAHVPIDLRQMIEAVQRQRREIQD